MYPLADLLICLRFFSRLPVPATERERSLGAGGLAAGAAMAPFAGAVLAGTAVLAAALALALRLPPTVASPLALTVLVIVTGAMHEDALADLADGFGGGSNRERKLAIMRDSRVGAFGAAAVALSLLIRASALAAALDVGRGACALLVAGTLSRAACLLPLAVLPPARSDGAGAGAVVTPGRALAAFVSAALLCAAFAEFGDAGLGRAAAATLAAGGSAGAVTVLARWQIGGQTGDVAGAAQQCAEAAALLAFAAGYG